MSHRDSSREEILDRAVQLSSVKGLKGLTIGQLASAVNMSKGGICAHFPSKESLQLAVIERASATFAEAVVVPTLTRPEGRERLQALADSWVAYLRRGVFQGGCFFTNILLELDDLDHPLLLQAARAQYQRFLEFIRGLVARCQELGQLNQDLDPAAFAWEFNSYLAGALTFRGLGLSEEGLALTRASIAGLLSRSQ